MIQEWGNNFENVALPTQEYIIFLNISKLEKLFKIVIYSQYYCFHSLYSNTVFTYSLGEHRDFLSTHNYTISTND